MIQKFFYLLTLLVLILAIAALGINLWVVQQMDLALQSAIAAVDDLADEEFEYDYRFRQVVPFTGEVPVRQDVVIPVHTTVPVSTVLQVAVTTPAGQVELPVPVQLEIPIDTEVSLRINQPVNLDVEVPIDTVLHLRFKMSEPPFRDLLQGVRAWLVGVRSSLSGMGSLGP